MGRGRISIYFLHYLGHTRNHFRAHLGSSGTVKVNLFHNEKYFFSISVTKLLCLLETEPFMRNIFLVITLLLTLQSCDDGDLIVTTFDFEEIELKQCGIWGDLVFYKINNSTYESL